MNDILERFTNLYEHDWTVTRYGDWLLVRDTATVWWLPIADLLKNGEGALTRFEETSRLPDASDASHAYSNLCQELRGYHDDAVPVEVLHRAAEDLGWALPIAHGW